MMKKNMMKTFAAVFTMALAVTGSYTAQTAAAAVTAESTARVQEAAYEKYQKLIYSDAAGNKTLVTILSDKEETSFQLQFDYYGVDAALTAEKTGEGQYRITNGDFFQTAGQKLIKKAVAAAAWSRLD